MPDTPPIPAEQPLADPDPPLPDQPPQEPPPEANANPSAPEDYPMIEVHPPHETIHTVKDFLIHIAAIAVGLLLAIGLEQTVEYFHHLREVKEIREALQQERQRNRAFYNVNTAGFRYEAEELENNLHVFVFLQQHPGTPEEKLPGVLAWGFAHAPITASAWKNAQQTQVLGYMPSEETEANAQLYVLLDLVDKDALSAMDAEDRAGSYASVDPNPSHMTPTQVAAEIDLIQDAMRTNVNWAAHLKNLHQGFPDFSPAPTDNELNRISGWVRSAEDNKKLQAAEAATDSVMAPSYTALRAAQKAAYGH